MATTAGVFQPPLSALPALQHEWAFIVRDFEPRESVELTLELGTGMVCGNVLADNTRQLLLGGSTLRMHRVPPYPSRQLIDPNPVTLLALSAPTGQLADVSLRVPWGDLATDVYALGSQQLLFYCGAAGATPSYGASSSAAASPSSSSPAAWADTVFVNGSTMLLTCHPSGGLRIHRVDTTLARSSCDSDPVVDSQLLLDPGVGCLSADVGDLDRDGSPDIVVATSLGLVWLRGPAFAPAALPTFEPLPHPPVAVHLASLTLEHSLDVVVSFNNTDPPLFSAFSEDSADWKPLVNSTLNSSAWRFFPHVTRDWSGQGEVHLFAVARSADSTDELVFVTPSSDAVQLPRVHFGPIQPMDFGGDEVFSADVDDDGIPDLIANGDDGAVYYWDRIKWIYITTTKPATPDAPCGFAFNSRVQSESSTKLNRECDRVVAHDIDGDGTREIVCGHYWNLQYFRLDPTDGVWRVANDSFSHPLEDADGELTFVDFDNDGVAELMVQQRDSVRTFYVPLNQTTQRFCTKFSEYDANYCDAMNAVELLNLESKYVVGVADITKNGFRDIMADRFVANKGGYFDPINDGVPQRPLAEGLDFFNTGMDPYNQLYAADLNGDGLHDLLTFGSDFQTPSLSFLRGESPNGTYPFGYPEPQAQVERNTNLEFHVLHDWDLDGNLDLLGSSYFGSWVYTNPRGNGHGRLHHLPLIGLKRMHVGDFDSDGDLDSLGPDGTGIFENLSHDPSRTRIVELRVDYDTGSDFACSQRHQWTVSGTQLPCRTIGGAIRAAASFSGGPVRIELLGSRANVTEPLSVHGILGRKVTIDIPADGFELDCSFLATRTASRHQGASCVTFSSTLSSVRFRGGQLTVSGWNVSAFPSARGAVTFGFTNFDDTTVSHEAALGLWCNQTDLNNLAGCKSTDANTYFGPSAASQHWLRIVGAQSVTSGACLRIEHAGNLTLRGVSLVDCRSSNRGGAVAIVDSTNVRLLRFHVASARADLEGGALTVVRSSHVSLEDGVIEDCESLVSGGGLHLEDILGLSLTRLTVRGCRAPRCAGAQFVASELSGVDRIAALKSCAFESNRAEVSTGGGLCASSIRLDVSGSFTLRNNTAVTDGGGAHVETGGIRSSDGCILSVLHNRAERGDGGGIVSVNSAIEVHGEDTSATVAHNTALEGTGGGIAADGVSTVEFAVTGFVNVSHNSADLGGGLSCVGTAASSNSRLRVAWAAGVPDLHHFSFNTARRGGGVYALLCQVSLGYVHLFRNEATLAGGGAHITTTYYSTILSTTTFTGCSVRGEGAGGALYISIPSLDAASFYVWAKFFNNSVPLGSGGAVYFEAGDGTSAPQLDSNPGGVAGNTALAGPVYASSARSLDILHSSSVDTQVSRAPFTGDLVYELRDVFGQRAAGDSTAQVRLNVLSSSDERASFLGRDTQIRATAGVANFTAKDVQLEAPPGSRVVVEVGTLPAFLEVQNRTFEVVMQDCLPGSFVQDGLRCRPCSRGQSSAVVNAAECELCPEHTIARREGQAQCEPCLPPSFSLGRGGLECSLCTANQYALFPANRSFTECRRCPAFTRCYTDGRVEAVSGFWADFDPQTGAYHAFRCPRRDNCESGSCQAGRVDADDNPLCGRCLDGLTDWIGECLECESTRWDLVLVLTALCLLVVGMLHVLAQDIKGGEVDVLLYYAQTVVLVVGSDRVSVLYVLESLNLNFALASGPNCISPLEQHEQLLLHLVSPLFVYVAWLLLLGASALLRRCSTAEFRFAPWVRSLVALYVFSFNSQATAIVEYFHCIEVTHRGATVEVNESFPAVSCTSQEWEDLWPLASALAAVFLVLVPASLLVAVVWSRRPGRAPRLQQMLGIMTQMYRPRVWAWGFVVLLRRALLVIAAVQLAEEPLDRLVVLSMLNTVFCVSAIVVKPWKSAGDNTADGVALSLLTVLTMFLPLLDEPYSDLTNAVLGVSILLPTVGFVLWTLRTKFQRLCGKAQPGVESKSDPTASTPLSSPRHHSKRKLSGVGPSSSRPSSLELSSLS